MVRSAIFDRHLDQSDRDYNHQWKTWEDYVREQQEEATDLTRNITSTVLNMFFEEYEKEAAKAPPPAPDGPKKRFTPDEVDAMVKEMYGSNYRDLWEEAMMSMDIKTMTQLERQFPGIDWGRQSNMDMLDDHGEQERNAYEAFRTYTRKALGRLTV